MRKVGPRTVPQFRQCLQSAWREISLYYTFENLINRIPKIYNAIEAKGGFFVEKKLQDFRAIRDRYLYYFVHS